MIPRDFITEWRAHAPWVSGLQVEQDLVISRALVELFSRPAIRAAPPTDRGHVAPRWLDRRTSSEGVTGGGTPSR